MKKTVFVALIGCGLVASFLVGISMSQAPSYNRKAPATGAEPDGAAAEAGAVKEDASDDGQPAAEQFRRQLLELFQQRLETMEVQELKQLLARNQKQQLLRQKELMARNQKQLLQEQLADERAQLEIQLADERAQLEKRIAEQRLDQGRIAEERVVQNQFAKARLQMVQKEPLAEEKLQLVQKLLRRIVKEFPSTRASHQAKRMLQLRQRDERRRPIRARINQR